MAGADRDLYFAFCIALDYQTRPSEGGRNGRWETIRLYLCLGTGIRGLFQEKWHSSTAHFD